MAKRMIEMPKWLRWYIFGEYHCDECPYSWEERGIEDADAGCFLFEELRDTCRHIRNPISQMIVNKHKNEYDSQWDGWIEYSNEYENCERVYKNISDRIKAHEYVPDMLREFYEGYDECHAIMIMREIVNEYGLIVHPYKKPWQKCKEAFAEWRKDFVWRHFKIYFRRKGE